MTSVRVRTCVSGATLAVAAGVLVDHGAVFGADFLKTAVLGLAAGAVLGLVPQRSAPERAAAFLAGFVAAWIGYFLRGGVLPDIPMGRALAAVVVVSLITAVATATADRLPLWSGLLGAATFVGAYEVVYTTTPANVGSESFTAATSVLLAVAIGFLVSTLAAGLVPAAAGGSHAQRAQTAADVEAQESSTSLDALLTPVPTPRHTSTDAPTSTSTTSESER